MTAPADQSKVREARKAVLRRAAEWLEAVADIDSFQGPAGTSLRVLPKKLVRDLRDAALQVVQGWQPIKTAPRDGTMILVHGGVAHWYNGQWYTLTAEVYSGRPIEWEVKHWMPLPEPPVRPSKGKRRKK